MVGGAERGSLALGLARSGRDRKETGGDSRGPSGAPVLTAALTGPVLTVVLTEGPKVALHFDGEGRGDPDHDPDFSKRAARIAPLVLGCVVAHVYTYLDFGFVDCTQYIRHKSIS